MSNSAFEPSLRNRDVAEMVSVWGGHRTTASRPVHLLGSFPNKRHILVHLGLPRTHGRGRPSARAKMGAVNMRPTAGFAALLERFFTERLMTQRQVSSNTIASYRDTFHLLLEFAQKRLGKAPFALALADLDAPLISAFLDDLEHNRGVIARTRNLRLTAIRSFFRYAAYQEPTSSGQIQQILSIPSKRHDRRLVEFLTREEIEALLDAPNLQTWDGRRDRAFLMMAIQTGLRLSELTGLKRCDVVLREGAHVRCVGKGRKERSTPLTSQMVGVLKTWLKE